MYSSCCHDRHHVRMKFQDRLRELPAPKKDLENRSKC
ncbi:unnamed protein product [Amoebophrya sp. A25]|nr:unnamed protein product [Amoebophrya sp. A25]|eukprot:GSA25T00027295001.1